MGDNDTKVKTRNYLIHSSRMTENERKREEKNDSRWKEKEIKIKSKIMHVTTINVLPSKECDRPHSIWLWNNGHKPETSFILSLSLLFFFLSLSNRIFIFRRSRVSIAPVQQLVKLRATGEETRSVEKNMATTKYRHNDCATMRFKSQMKCEIDAAQSCRGAHCMHWAL